jgi:antitoxin YefM
MYRIPHTDAMAKIVPFTEARASLAELLDALEDTHEHVLITRNRRPSAVMLSADEYESLEETLEILQDRELMEVIRKSEADVRAGRFTSLDDLRSNVANGPGQADP